MRRILLASAILPLIACSMMAFAKPAGQFKQVEVEVVQVNGQQLIDLGVLTRALELDEIWNALGRKVVIANGDKFLVLFVGSNRVALEGKIIRLPTSPMIVNGAILVPVDFITAALNKIMDKPLTFEIVGQQVVIFDPRVGMTEPTEPEAPKPLEMNHLHSELVQNMDEAATNGTLDNGGMENGSVDNGAPLRFGNEALDVIAIDPGHGGGDTGDSGPTGLLEKELTLKLAMRLKKVLERQLGVRVVLTREADVPVSLETRTAIANREKADVMISLHAHGSLDRDKGGFRAFVASVEPSDAETSKTVAAENEVIELEPGNEAQKADEYARMLWELSQNEYFREGVELANRMLGACGSADVRLTSPEPSMGPFIVLIGASMPAVLLEIGYLSNPADEQLLKDGEYLDKMAGAIYRGIAAFKTHVEKQTPAECR